MIVHLNYFKNQHYHKYTHLLQMYGDFSCTDLSHGFHHVNVWHDLLRYFCIDFSLYFLTLTVYCIRNCLKRYILLLLLFIFSLYGLGGVPISIVLTNEVKHVQLSRPCRAEWYFLGRRENAYGLWVDN
jgi:hypothetical protein